jgi:hypothetical protein
MRLAGQRLGADRVAKARHRIEHAELLTDVPALARTGLLASVQPAFDATWGGEDGMYAQRLGPDRAGRLNPLAALVAAGTPLALGSDSPVTPIDPWGAIRAAVHPKYSRHALTVRVAMAAHTRGGWRAAGADGDGSGTLVPGAPASYAIFETTWAAGPLGLPDLAPDLAPGRPLPRCQRTVLRGRQLYDSGELE